jgi:uncharacterized protein (DUF1015 family)
VPHFAPFRGVRYDPQRAALAEVTAPPYDVIDVDLRAALVARHPANVVRIDLPDDGSPGPYERAADSFARWQTDGTLVRDAQPAFYVYRIDFVDDEGRARRTTGVLGALQLTRPGERPDGVQPILPHEYTTPKAKSDRLDLQRATHANLSPIWGLSPATGLTALLDCDQLPVVDFHDDESVRHRLWVIDDPDRQAAITAAVEDHPVVVADGHHRYETALNYQSEQGAAGGHDATLCWMVELVDDELSVGPIHRLLTGLPTDLAIEEALEPFFRVGDRVTADSGLAALMRDRDALVLVEPGRARLLAPNYDALRSARDLDTSRLDLALASLPPHELSFQHGIDHVVALVDKGDASAGVLLRPVTVAQIVDIAHGGERMPPKTTFFYPKPRTGMVFRLLDE